MTRALAIVGVVVLIAAIAVFIVPMWLAAAQFGLPVEGWLPVALTVVLCFGIGGGLMALMFISSRRGYDDAAHSASRELEGEAGQPITREPPPALPPLRKP